MRNISGASLATLQTRYGVEPSIIMEVQWSITGNWTSYADKEIAGIPGKILQIDNLDDVINLTKTGVSQSVSVMLDDTDGELKNIFNNCDIHNRKVRIYQWFTNLPTEEKFLLFGGRIVSPISWKEGERSLSFTVMSGLQRQDEIGFSAEEGDFPNLPLTLVGKVWPLCFGTPIKVPCLLVDDIPHGSNSSTTSTANTSSSLTGGSGSGRRSSGGGSDSGDKQGTGAGAMTTDGTGIQDPSMESHIKDNEEHAVDNQAIALINFVLYLEASYTARKLGELDEFSDISQGKGRFSSLAQGYLTAGNKALADAGKIKNQNEDLKGIQQKQKDHEKSSIGVTNGDLFPQGVPTTLNLNGGIHKGIFLGNEFLIQERAHPLSELYNGMNIPPVSTRVGEPVVTRTDYFFAQPGLPLRYNVVLGSTVPGTNGKTVVSGNTTATTTETDEGTTTTVTVIADDADLHPVRYIAAGTIQVQINALYAYRTTNNVRQLAVIPSNLYHVYQINFGTMPATLLYFPAPLSSFGAASGDSQGWEDDVFANVTSPIGPNTVEILIWLITNYTDCTYDPISFGTVHAAVATYPMHFALMDRPQVFQLLADIAYQARCTIWCKNDVFYIKYLPEKDFAVDTITDDDILEQTLEVTYDKDTEDLVTKYVAEWKSDYLLSNPNLIIHKYHTLQYGVQEKQYNYFAYNLQQLVQKSATFWTIREANLFKQITFKTPISKLRLETLDTVTLNLSNKIVANGPVDCIVQQAVFDPTKYEIEFTLWAPVRAGEMEEYVFAYMKDLAIEVIFPNPPDIAAGNVLNNSPNALPPLLGGGANGVPISGAYSTQNVYVKLPTTAAIVASGQPGATSKHLTKPFSGDGGNGGQIQITHRPLSWGADPLYQNDNPAGPSGVTPIITQRIDTSAIAGASGTKPPGTTQYQYNKQQTTTAKAATSFPITFPGIITKKIDTGTYEMDGYREGFDKQPQKIQGRTVVQNQTVNVGDGVMITEIFVYGEKGEVSDVKYFFQAQADSGKSVYPGYIKSGNKDSGYTVQTFKDGKAKPETDLLTGVQILMVNSDESEFPADTPVFVVEVHTTDTNNQPSTEYYIQPPVWL
jgi:hypothetical protein